MLSIRALAILGESQLKLLLSWDSPSMLSSYALATPGDTQCTEPSGPSRISGHSLLYIFVCH